jgi:hypothetical protein
MILPSFEWLCCARRYDANGFFPQCECDKKQTVLDHSNDRKSLFAIVVPVINLFDGEWISEYGSRRVWDKREEVMVLWRVAIM